MKKLLQFVFLYILGKPIKIDVMSTIGEYYVTQVDMDANWDGTYQTVITLKTLHIPKRKIKNEQ